MPNTVALSLTSHSKRDWTLAMHRGGVDTDIVRLSLKLSSATNRFDLVSKLFEDISTVCPEFGPWYSAMLVKYMDEDLNAQIIIDEIPNFIEIANRYYVLKNIPVDTFVDMKKVSKTSIVFDPTDLKNLILSSICLKLYAPIFCDTELNLPENNHREVYSAFLGVAGHTVIDKIYQTIRSRVFRRSITDRYMWDLVKIFMIETPESYTLNMFNFMMTSLLAILEIESNPIPFLVRTVDDSIRWMIMSMYKNQVAYGDNSAGISADLYKSSKHSDILTVYCCNDTIGKIASSALDILESEYNVTDDAALEVRSKLDNLKVVTPAMKCLTMPIISKVLDIPYSYLQAASPAHIVLLGVAMKYALETVAEGQYPAISSYLGSIPAADSVIKSTSYKYRNIVDLVNSKDDRIFGISSQNLRFHVMSNICGILIASKKSSTDLVTGEKISISSTDIEDTALKFFMGLYSGRLNDLFEKMRGVLAA